MLQGLRIDYVLCSRGLLPQVVSCEIMDTPPKWSDHAGGAAAIVAAHDQHMLQA
jgi:exonuclease III